MGSQGRPEPKPRVTMLWSEARAGPPSRAGPGWSSQRSERAKGAGGAQEGWKGEPCLPPTAACSRHSQRRKAGCAGLVWQQDGRHRLEHRENTAMEMIKHGELPEMWLPTSAGAQGQGPGPESVWAGHWGSCSSLCPRLLCGSHSSPGTLGGREGVQ